MKKKIKVPEGMLNAAWEAVAAKMKRHIEEGQAGHVAELHVARIAVEAALTHITNNPYQPNEEQMDELVSRHSWLDKDSVRYGAREWQRVMFLAPEPAQTPEEHDAQIRRECRRRCLDELAAVSKGADIEAGVGVDVQRAYYQMLARMPENISSSTPSTVDNLLWGDWYRDRGVPEEVNGILVIQSHNAQVEEAFKRGRLSVDSGAKHGPAQDADQNPQDEG